MISPLVVIASIEAGVRVYRAGDRALAQKLRDRAMPIPGARFPAIPEEKSAAALRDLAEGQEFGFGAWIEAEPERREAYRSMLDGEARGLARVRLLWMTFERDRRAADAAGEESAEESAEDVAARLTYDEIPNWTDEDAGPIPPWASFAVALADIAADFVAANPQIVIEGRDGRALTGAFASSIAALIPDDGNYGRRQAVGSRLMGVVLRAGLETLASNRRVLFGTEEVRQLVDATVRPVIDAFPGSLPEQQEWERVTDAVMGPAASAAFRVVAERPAAFLGARFDTGGILGAMTRDLLSEASALGPGGAVSREGLITLYTATLDVVAARPELVVGEDGARGDFLRTLLRDLAGVLRDDPLGFDAGLGALLARAALEGFGAEAGRLLSLDPREPWEKLAAEALRQTLDGLAEGVGERRRLDALFTQEELVALVRLAAAEAGRTPEMIAGGSVELRGVVAALSSALAGREAELLDGRGWLEVAAAALGHAARNPGRLFGLAPSAPSEELGARVIAAVLSEGAASARGGRAGGGVLFGETLRDALLAALAAAASNPCAMSAALEQATDGRVNLALLLERISGFVALADAAGRRWMGAAEWLRLFRILLPETLLEGRVPLLVEAGQPTELGLDLIERMLTEALEDARS